MAALAAGYSYILKGNTNEVELLLIPGMVALVIFVNGRWIKFLVVLNVLLLFGINYFRTATYRVGIDDEYIKLIVVILVSYVTVYYFVYHFKTKLMEALSQAFMLTDSLSKSERALTKSNHAKLKMFTVISHDLKAPVSLVKRLLNSITKEVSVNEGQMNRLNNIRLRIREVQQTMINLLAWAQIQMDDLGTPDKDLVDVDKELSQIIDVYSDAIYIKDLTVNVSGEQGLLVCADKSHFVIIMRTLFHYAVKFTPNSGWVIIRLSKIDKGISVTISDSGKGISDVNKSKLLNQEYIDPIIDEDGEEDSLVSLNFCVKLIEQNGGKLSISDSEAGGTLFELSLPKSVDPLP